MTREVHVGALYRHFKGNIYVVDDVATHTETNEELVIYHRLASDKEYARPKEMFLSEVDKEKYPDCEQKWRFELTEWLHFTKFVKPILSNLVKCFFVYLSRYLYASK